MNIAEIGFSAKTGDLKTARADLDALSPAARKAESAAENFNRAAAGITGSTKGASAGIRSFQSAASGAAATTGNLTKAALATSTAMGTVGRAAMGVKPTMDLVSASAERQVGRLDILRAKWSALIERLTAVGPATARAGSSLDRLGAAANDNINRLQATPGNVAAQFQDIGVTAAAGMNPMLIALQQGTQLSAAMGGGIGNLLAGFKQLLAPTAILTIGFVGLAAAGLQMIDWVSVGKSLLYGLADAMETVAVAAVYLGAVLAIAFAPQIITSIGVMTAKLIGGLLVAIKAVTGAMIAFSLANPFGAIVLAIGAVIGAMILLNDTFGGVFTDALAWVKKAANFIIGALVGAFNAVKATWKMLPAAMGDYVMQAVNAVLRGVENMVNGSVSLVNGLTAKLPFGIGENLQMGNVTFGQVDNPFSGMAAATESVISAEIGKAQGVDYVQGIVDGVSGLAGWAAGKLRGLADSLGLKDDKDSKGKSAGMSEAEKIAKAYLDLTKATEARIFSLQTETKALGMSEHAARSFRNEQDLLAQATAKGIPLTEQVVSALGDLAARLTNAEIGKEIAEMNKAFEDQKQVLKDQAELIGLSGLELEYTAIRQGLVNDAVSRGVIDLANMNDEMREYVALLGDRAMTLARGGAANKTAEFVANMTEAHEQDMFALRRERGEINLTGAALAAYRMETDMLVSAKQKNIDLSETDLDLLRQQAVEYAVAEEAIRKQREEVEHYRETYRGFFSSMIDGLREGQSVWQAFGNAVMSVVNRIIDRLLTMDGGILDKLVNLGGSLLGGIGPSKSLLGDVNSTMAANPSIFARGGTFGVEKFAQGGAFTNGIYTRPTLFKFASGGALGEMGEAGPEAVMPLKRGPNGSLGVEMHRSAPVRVVVTADDDRFDAYVDGRSEQVSARSAPGIADAGARVGSNRQMKRQKRTLNG